MLLSGDRAAMTRQLLDVLEGYEAFMDFDWRELRLIEPLRTLRMLHHSAWIARRWSDPAFPIAFPWFASPAYWADQCTRLARAARGDGRAAARQPGLKRDALATPRSGQQQRVDPPHVGRRILELAALGEQRLVEQDVRPGRRSARSTSSRFTSACSALTSRIGWPAGAPCPACFSRRARWPLMSPSSTTRQAGESTSRVVTRTSLARSLSEVFSRSSVGLNAVAASSACFFSASSCELAEVDRALGDALQRMAVELVQVREQPLVDAVGQQQHLDALLLEDLELRAVLRRRQRVGGDVVDRLLAFLHAPHVLGQRHALARRRRRAVEREAVAAWSGARGWRSPRRCLP